jgi:geranylgeranyl pyrophosphate synthase
VLAVWQVVDDVLDFTGSTEALGKPALSDMEQGLATAPTLFAAEEFPEIVEIVQRRFADEGDVANVAQLVQRSDGVRRSQELAISHAQSAADALGMLPPSTARDALLRLCFDVLNRKA